MSIISRFIWGMDPEEPGEEVTPKDPPAPEVKPDLSWEEWLRQSVKLMTHNDKAGR